MKFTVSTDLKFQEFESMSFAQVLAKITRSTKEIYSWGRSVVIKRYEKGNVVERRVVSNMYDYIS